MVYRILRALLAFALVLWAANALFGPTRQGPSQRGEAGLATLFEKDLQSRIKAGSLVVVDQHESDRYIQEDLSTHDLAKALTFARLKSEVLERPLYIENARTFGRENSVARVNPTDRRAWQELTLLEMQLKDTYERAHPGDVAGYVDEKAMDAKRTPEAMVEFIGRYPESHVASTALAHLEYALCVAQRNPARAIAIYDKLAKAHADQPYLASLLPEYRSRAQEYQKAYQEEASPSPQAR